MRESRAIATVAGVVILGAVATLWLVSNGGLPPRVNKRAHELSGAELARQALSLRQPEGQINLIVRDTTTFPNPASDIQLAAFKKVIGNAHATIDSILTLAIDPLRPMEVPPGDFYQLIKRTPKGSVIVSFLGPPLLSLEQGQRLGEVKPSIVAFCSGSLPQRLNLKAFFEQGLLQAAVVSRRTPGRSVPRDAHGWFDDYFIAVTTVNLAELAPPNDTP